MEVCCLCLRLYLKPALHAHACQCPGFVEGVKYVPNTEIPLNTPLLIASSDDRFLECTGEDRRCSLGRKGDIVEIRASNGLCKSYLIHCVRTNTNLQCRRDCSLFFENNNDKAWEQWRFEQKQGDPNIVFKGAFGQIYVSPDAAGGVKAHCKASLFRLVHVQVTLRRMSAVQPETARDSRVSIHIANEEPEGPLSRSPCSSLVKLLRPRAIAVDHVGNTIIAHCGKIIRISPQGELTVLAKRAEEDGVLEHVVGVAVDQDGNLIIADAGSNCIRKITSNGTVSILAGSGTASYKDGPALDACFHHPRGVAVDSEGNIIVADTHNHCIRKITPQGLVLTVAGWGSAIFKDPSGVAIDHQGNIIVADSGHHRIQKISPIGVTTVLAGSSFAGCQDGKGLTAFFNRPMGVAVDYQNNVLVADFNNHLVRSVTPEGTTCTLQLSELGTCSMWAVSVDYDDNVLAADWDSNSVRKLSRRESRVLQELLEVSRSVPRCRMRPSVYKGLLDAIVYAPVEGPFRGGIFGLSIDLRDRYPTLRPVVRFKSPIFHCNVSSSGEVIVSTPWSMDSTFAGLMLQIYELLISPDVSNVTNPAAYNLWKEDRINFNIRAWKAASESWGKTLCGGDSLSVVGLVDFLVPREPLMDRRAQHQVFQQVALLEIQQHLQTQEDFGPLSKTNHPHLHALYAEELKQATAESLWADLKLRLTHTLTSLMFLEDPIVRQRMEWLEDKLAELFLSEKVTSSCTPSALLPPFIEKLPRNSAECFKMLLLEAEREQARLIELIDICMKKYELLFRRFDVLKRIDVEPQEQICQPLKSEATFYIAQAKRLEPSFRSKLKSLVQSINQEDCNVDEQKRSLTKLRLLSGTYVKVVFGPAKSLDRIAQKKGAQPHLVCDYLRATIVAADPFILANSYSLLLSTHPEFVALRTKNKYIISKLDQPPNLHANFLFCGNHVCEIQFILEDFFLIKSYSHKPYEIARIGRDEKAQIKEGADLQKAVELIVLTGVSCIHPGLEEYPT